MIAENLPAVGDLYSPDQERCEADQKPISRSVPHTIGAYQEHTPALALKLGGTVDHDEIDQSQQIVFFLEPEDLLILSVPNALYQ